MNAAELEELGRLVVTPELLATQPAWVGGSVAPAQAILLSGLVQTLRPERAVEIGVASGWGSLVLLQAMQRAAGGRDFSLVGIDLSPEFYLDKSIPTGRAVEEVAPDLKPRYRLRTGRLGFEVTPELGALDFAFIDANHLHPWATFDLLAVLPSLARGSWIAMHDINLCRVPRQNNRNRGPFYLFYGWPDARLESTEELPMIGAVQLEREARDYLPLIWDLLRNPWETAVAPATLERLSAFIGNAFGQAAAAAFRDACAAGASLPQESEPAASMPTAAYEICLDAPPRASGDGQVLLRGVVVNRGAALPARWQGEFPLRVGAELLVGADRRKLGAARASIGTSGLDAGASVPFEITVPTGAAAVGEAVVHLDLLYEKLAWLESRGGTSLEVPVAIGPPVAIEHDRPLADPQFWKQHAPRINPASEMGIKAQSFQTYIVETSAGPLEIRSMLTEYELAVLYALARDHYRGDGYVVDLGPLLGVGTRALANGLAQNPRTPQGKRLYSYDLFLREGLTHFLPGPDGAATASVFERFLETNRDHLDRIVPVPGDILKMRWIGEPIEILFIDLAKTWALNRHVLEQFFPHLVPGHSVIIQQDYVHIGEPWIAPTMELLAEYFEPLYFIYGASSVYRLIKPIPPEVLKQDLQAMPLPAIDALFARAMAKATPAIVEVLKCCQAAIYIERGELAGAAKLIKSVDETVRDGNDPSQEFHSAIRGNLVVARRWLDEARGTRRGAKKRGPSRALAIALEQLRPPTALPDRGMFRLLRRIGLERPALALYRALLGRTNDATRRVVEHLIERERSESEQNRR